MTQEKGGFDGWEELLVIRGVGLRSCACPARSALTSDAWGNPGSLGHFQERTEHVPMPLTERPASRVALPAWPILHLLRRNGPLRLDYVSREPQQGRQQAARASHAQAFRSSPWGRGAAEFQGIPSPDLTAVLLLQPQPQGSRTADRNAG